MKISRIGIALTIMTLALGGLGCQKAASVAKSDVAATEKSTEVVDSKLKQKSPYGEDQPGTPTIMNLGIEFGRYDKETGKAGDLVFFDDVFYPRMFREFGIIVEGPNLSHKRLPEFDYYVAPFTLVLAVADGTIDKNSFQPGMSDFVWLRPVTHPNWIIEYDHVQSIGLVKPGDVVKAGQPIAVVPYRTVIGRTFDFETNTFSGGTEMGMFEMMIISPDKQFHCPTALLDPSVEKKILQEVTDLMEDWETYKGDTALYDENAMSTMGCLKSEYSEAELPID